jgi:hypothetical protein
MKFLYAERERMAQKTTIARINSTAAPMIRNNGRRDLLREGAGGGAIR